jgi:hypothetical protein
LPGGPTISDPGHYTVALPSQETQVIRSTLLYLYRFSHFAASARVLTLLAGLADLASS